MADERLEVELEILPPAAEEDPDGAPGPEHADGEGSKGRRLRVVGLVALAVAVGVGGAVFVLRDEPPANPDTALREVQRNLDGLDGFRFTLNGDVTTTWGVDDIGQDTVDHYTAEGVWSRDGWQVETRTWEGPREIVVAGDDVLVRGTERGSPILEDEPWVRATEAPLDDDVESGLSTVLDYDDTFGGEPELIDSADLNADWADSQWVLSAVDWYFGEPGGVLLHANGFNYPPAGFVRIIEEMSASQVSDLDGGGRRIDGRVRARSTGSTREDFPDAAVRLTVNADGDPARLQLTVRKRNAVTRFDVRFERWDLPASVERPRDDEVDPTPTIDEEALRAQAALVAPVWPTELTDTWELSELTASSATSGEGEHGPVCQTIESEWSNSPGLGNDDWGNVRIVVLERNCMILFDVPAITPGGTVDPAFPAGPDGNRSVRLPDGSVVLYVDQSIVRITSTLSDAHLAPVLASIEPIDIETLIATATADLEPE